MPHLCQALQALFTVLRAKLCSPWVSLVLAPSLVCSLMAHNLTSHNLELSQSIPTIIFLSLCLSYLHPPGSALSSSPCWPDWNLNVSAGITSSRRPSLTTPENQSGLIFFHCLWWAKIRDNLNLGWLPLLACEFLKGLDRNISSRNKCLLEGRKGERKEQTNKMVTSYGFSWGFLT